MIDTHCHLDSTRFDSDRPELLRRAHAAGVEAIVLPGVEPRSWEGLLRNYAGRSQGPRVDAATGGFLCVCPQKDNAFHSCDHRNQIDGSVAFVTSVFGMNMAGVVVRRLASALSRPQIPR